MRITMLKYHIVPVRLEPFRNVETVSSTLRSAALGYLKQSIGAKNGLKAAFKKLENNKPQKAKSAFEQIVRETKNSIEKRAATVALGWMNFFLADSSEEVSYFQSVLDEDPNYVPANVGRGWEYLQKNRYEDAKNCFANALLQDKTCLGALSGMGWILLEEEHVESAQDHFLEVLRRDPLDIEAAVGLAWTYLKQMEHNISRGLFPVNDGLGKQAQAYFLNATQAAEVRALERQETSHALIESMAGLAWLYVVMVDGDIVMGKSFEKEKRGYQGGCELIVQLFEHVLEKDPNYLEAHLALGWTFFKLGKANGESYCKAEASFQKACQIEPESQEAKIGLGYSAIALEKYSVAADSFQEVLTRDPNHIEALMGMGKIALEQQGKETAIDYFNHALRLNPDHAIAHKKLGMLLMQQQEWDEAKAHLQYSHDARSRVTLGRILMKQKQGDKAEVILHEVLEANPNHIAARVLLGRIYLSQNKNLEEVERYFQIGLQDNPDDLDALMGMGWLCIKQQKYDKAKEYLAQAKRLSPENTEIEAAESLVATLSSVPVALKEE